jgi:hypothetical protein
MLSLCALMSAFQPNAICTYDKTRDIKRRLHQVDQKSSLSEHRSKVLPSKILAMTWDKVERFHKLRKAES